MRAPLLSFVLVLAVVATMPLVPGVECISRYEKPESKGEEAAGTVAEEHGGSIKPLSVDGYGPLEKATKKPKEETLNVEATPVMIPDTYDQKPIEEQTEKATSSNADDQPDQYVESLVPDEKVKEEAAKEAKKGKSDESDESEYPKKAKKVKKEKSNDESDDKKEKKEKKKSDYLDESTSSKKEKKEKSDDSDNKKEKKKSDYLDESISSKKEKKEMSDDSDESSSSKKKKKAKSDDSDEDASLLHKKKKEKKEKSLDDSEKYESGKKEKKHKSDDSDSTPSPKKEKKEKSIDSDASKYFKKEDKKSGDSDDEVTSPKKQKKDKKKKEKSGDYFDKETEENPKEDAAPVDVAPDGEYVSPKEKKSGDDDAMPVDGSTTTDQYVPSSKYDGKKPKGGEHQISTNADAYASPKQHGANSQPMAGGSPDELPPATKSSATSDAYASPKQSVVSSSQPMAGGSPDELPPQAKYASLKVPMAGGSQDELPPAAKKSSATPDVYASSKQQQVASISQPMAGGSPDELPPAAKSGSGTPDSYASLNEPAAAGKPKLSMETFSGMIKRPIAKFLSPVIKSVCAKTQYPEDCETSIGGLPGAASAAATDSVGVLKLAMEAVRQKVIEATNAATDRMTAPGTDDTTKEALSSCTSSYSDMKTSLDMVDDALKRGDVDTAHTNLDSVETDITTCDDGFQERGTPSVMTDHDQELQKLASNLLSIGAAIHH